MTTHASAPMRDRLRDLLAEPTTRRVLLLAAFLGALWATRGLLVFLLCFVATAELVETGVRRIRRVRPAMPRSRAVGLATAAGLGFVALLGWLGGTQIVAGVAGAAQYLPVLITTVTGSPLWAKLVSVVPEAAQVADVVRAWLSEHAAKGFAMATAFGHGLLLAAIGVLVGLVYAAEREQVQALWTGLAPATASATLVRWVGYVVEGVSVMIRTQVMVALVNAALTIPILVLLKLPAVPTLTALVFLGSLVPVVGNAVMGVVLALVAASVDGLAGAITITVLTVVLHKIESYFINPHFAASKLRLPAFLIILSLLICERIFGLAGLFISLPALVVFQRIRAEFLAPATAPASEAGADIASAA